MNGYDPAHGAKAVYEFWLSLIPQFISPFGAALGARQQEPITGNSKLPFPVDQIEKAAQMMQQSLAAFAQAAAPSQDGPASADLLTRWADAINTQQASGIGSIAKAWSELGRRGGWPTKDELETSFNRTYGALADAFGLGSMRGLQREWQRLLEAATAYEQARATYALAVNSALTAGYGRLLQRLAGKAEAGERIDSVFALLKLWAVCTEEAVHEALQSDRGLAATAALTRASLAYRKALQQLSRHTTDSLALASRSDLDEAFREIQALKREVRQLRRQQGTEQ
ncbi:poly(R)-hydroxyalkanoic acid synthase subunit PhaE [Piscinibacter sakaiensis]|uniref:poly(R)-hydroxyalkanoic acid synthase subunit PhaE n=1 Tax=Piscinibacter sakaiensis TaxID=1547922 RepID=UPI003AACEA7A